MNFSKKINLGKHLLNVEKPAQYLGNEINSIHKHEYKTHMCLVFPDLYSVGMSNLGIRILYNLLNKVNDFYIERAFHPMDDMEKILIDNKIPMFSLETKTPLIDFDVVGFSFSYELSYPNALNILKLANIPFSRLDRNESHPLIMAGGTCMMNPSVMEKFCDYIVIGDGEEVMVEIAKIFVENYDKSKTEKLNLIKDLKGVYVPSLHQDKIIDRAIVEDLNSTEYYDEQIVPYIDVVHDRATVEIQRGCSRGCRFCQAGIVYRPVRERSLEKNLELIDKMIDKTGYSEISLSSLSSSDYSNIYNLIYKLKENVKYKNLSISLPSLRMNPMSVKVAEDISGGKRTGFTFAPEAGSQRMRDIINKGVNKEEIIETAKAAVTSGWINLKFYFMVGLPFETDEDVIAISDLCKEVLLECKKISKKINITVSVSNFVPKPHTPFQWAKQMNFEEMKHKHNILKDSFNNVKNISLKIHDGRKSYIEGFLSRADNKISDLIEIAYNKGVKLDDYRDNFKLWKESIEELKLDENYYLGSKSLDEKFCWDKVNTGVTKDFLKREWKKAQQEALTPECRKQCSYCGIKDIFPECLKIYE